jgi:release factor glutamine methyltransferase
LNLQEALVHGKNLLNVEDIETPAAEAGVILCHVVKKEKVYLYSHGEEPLTPEQQDLYFKLLNQRADGKPLQYITGIQEFMSLDFSVNENVLIPRQDTEILVETVLEYVKNSFKEKNIRILDIGTGSGCIAVSLAYYLPDIGVYAIDISKKALETAHLNSVKNNVEQKIRFINSDILRIIREDSYCELQNTPFDIVVSNPPYITAKVIESLKKEVKDFEPYNALYGGYDGLDFYRAINISTLRLLKHGGLIALEIGYDQADEVKELFKDTCSDIKIIKDLSGNDRVFYGVLK